MAHRASLLLKVALLGWPCFSRPTGALPLSGSCAPRATGRAIRHAPRGALPAPFGRGVRFPSGLSLRSAQRLVASLLFCRLARGVAGQVCMGFPLLAASQGLPHAALPRLPAVKSPFGGGACRPHPPLLRQRIYYTIGIGGAAPVNPCPRSARGGAVFFIVVWACAQIAQNGRSESSGCALGC